MNANKQDAGGLLDRMIHAGSLLSNVAFNLSQHASIRDQHGATLDDCRRQWDAALREYRAYGEQCRAASGELEELRAWKAEHQAFLVRLSVALVVDGGCKQDQIEACVDELIAERDNLRALSRGVPEGK